MEDRKLKEYDTLRAEILQKIELHNTLLTFTITTTVAALTYALSNDSIALYFIPFCILLPMSMRIAYYRSAMAKLSAYIIVFIEDSSIQDGLNWETRNNTLLCNEKKAKSKKILMHNFNSECLILSVIVYFFFALAFYSTRQLSLLNILLGSCPLILVLIEFLITKNSSISVIKLKWINKWNALKNCNIQLSSSQNET